MCFYVLNMRVFYAIKTPVANETNERGDGAARYILGERSLVGLVLRRSVTLLWANIYAETGKIEIEFELQLLGMNVSCSGSGSGSFTQNAFSENRFMLWSGRIRCVGWWRMRIRIDHWRYRIINAFNVCAFYPDSIFQSFYFCLLVLWTLNTNADINMEIFLLIKRNHIFLEWFFSCSKNAWFALFHGNSVLISWMKCGSPIWMIWRAINTDSIGFEKKNLSITSPLRCVINHFQFKKQLKSSHLIQVFFHFPFKCRL